MVGVFESFSVYENGAVFMLLDESAAADGPSRTGDRATSCRPIRPAIPRRSTHCATKIEALDPEIAATPCAEFVGSLNQMRVTRVMSWVISAVACLMGAFGILNTMAMSVFERRSEIGAFRAMGWRTWRVVVLIVRNRCSWRQPESARRRCRRLRRRLRLAHWHVTSGLVQGDLSLRAVCEGIAMAALMAILGAAYPALRFARLCAGRSPTRRLSGERILAALKVVLRSRARSKRFLSCFNQYTAYFVRGSLDSTLRASVVSGVAGGVAGVRSIIPHMWPPNLSCCHVPA